MSRQTTRLQVKINRKAPAVSLQPFRDYFKGFENVGAVRAVFGDKTESVLRNLKVSFISNRRMYMGIRDDDGNISVGTHHLKNSDLRILYLDIVHELFHIKQHMKDKEYFHKEHMKFMGNRSLYYASPIEVPAYKHTVLEAERIGMPYEEITEYLKMGPVSQKVFRKFLKEMNLKKDNPATMKSDPELLVEINRDAKIKLYPFTDYFKDFEKVEAVRALFGDKTKDVLDGLFVEFVDSPFRAIFPNEDDGHLIVGADYLKKSDVNSIYLGVLICLNFLKRMSENGSARDNTSQFVESSVLLETYRSVLEEAKRLKIPREKIMDHLQLPRFFMSPAEYNKLMRKLRLSTRG